MSKSTANKVPVIVFNRAKRAYQLVGYHPDTGDSVSVMEEHSEAIAHIFGDEHKPVKPIDICADGRAVRLYNYGHAIATAAWNFQDNGKSYNLPEPVAVYDNPVEQVVKPNEFYPDVDARCWCVPGRFGDNERRPAGVKVRTARKLSV